MQRDDLTYTGELVILTCWCGITHAVPSQLSAEQERQHRDGRPQLDMFCPLGHTHVIGGEGKAAKLQNELTRVTAELDQTVAELAATSTKLARQIKRGRNGVCPHCHRSFAQLARHVQSRHPAAKVTR